MPEHPAEPPLATRVMDAARVYAREDTPPLESLARELDDAPRPVFARPGEWQAALWDILAHPERARVMRWLDRQDLLTELFPAWEGGRARRNLRLSAMEQVHKEVWRPGLRDDVFQAICDTHDVVVDARLNRWALTALATLFAGGDIEDPRRWAKFVRRDLAAIGATEAEIVWVTGIIHSFTAAQLALRGEPVEADLRPELVVSGLSTLSLTEPDRLPSAIERANDAMRDQVNPLDRMLDEDD